MAWVTPPTFSATTLTAAQMQILSDDLSWLKAALLAIGVASDTGSQSVDSAVCGARAYGSADLTHNVTGDWFTVNLNSERWDLFDGAASTFHSTSSNTSRITIPAGLGGTYVIGGCIEFAAHATGERAILILLNGVDTLVIDKQDATASGAHVCSVVTTADLVAGNYIQMQGFQNSGGNLLIDSRDAFSPEFWAVRIGV